MNWSHVGWVFLRELRDQLRDRRTMFTICVLPMLLYPLMGLLMLQLAQVKPPQRFTIAIVGDSNWLETSGAVNDTRSATTGSAPTGSAPIGDATEGVQWNRLPTDSQIAVDVREKILPNRFPIGGPAADTDPAADTESATQNALVNDLLHRAEADAILCIADLSTSTSVTTSSPGLLVLSNQRLEKSRLAVSELHRYLEKWHHEWVRSRLEAQNVDRETWMPPQIVHLDIASAAQKQAVVWSKVLPFIMLVWALTGAFYPAIDLCAGEKERGTLETLLSSPATRREIVWGKLLTVMCFSIATALLNLTSMVVTSSFVFKHFRQAVNDSTFGGVGPISIDLIFWLVLLVIPMSAMFSALALAVASMARSTKEGQYYLMPLMLVGFPLVMLPVLPGMTLSTGTSIVPITGAVLLSRALMDGEYATALAYLPSVICVTALCCLLATRWAVRQFENESVLFSETEKGTLKHWLIRFWAQRSNHPSATESVLCGLAILVALFFGRLAMGTSQIEWSTLAKSTVVVQIGLMLGPTLIMAIMLTRCIRTSLRLSIPRLDDVIACGLLAICLHPSYATFATLVSREYPLAQETVEALLQFDAIIGQVPLWSILLVFAVLPAVCEEVVFRGFVFAGLLENKGVLRAVIGSAILFGLSHGVLQQSLCATVMGLILGWLAYRTGGIACTIVFHLIHNSISMTLASWSATNRSVPTWLSWAVEQQDAIEYSSYWSGMSAALSVVLLLWLSLRSNRNQRSSARELSGATISSNSIAGSLSQ